MDAVGTTWGTCSKSLRRHVKIETLNTSRRSPRNVFSEISRYRIHIIVKRGPCQQWQSSSQNIIRTVIVRVEYATCIKNRTSFHLESLVVRWWFCTHSARAILVVLLLSRCARVYDQVGMVSLYQGCDTVLFRSVPILTYRYKLWRNLLGFSFVLGALRDYAEATSAKDNGEGLYIRVLMMLPYGLELILGQWWVNMIVVSSAFFII